MVACSTLFGRDPERRVVRSKGGRHRESEAHCCAAAEEWHFCRPDDRGEPQEGGFKCYDGAGGNISHVTRLEVRWYQGFRRGRTRQFCTQRSTLCPRNHSQCVASIFRHGTSRSGQVFRCLSLKQSDLASTFPQQDDSRPCGQPRGTISRRHHA